MSDQKNDKRVFIAEHVVVEAQGFKRNSNATTVQEQNAANRVYKVIEPKTVGEWKSRELKVISWGENNDWPTQVIGQMTECGVGKKALGFASRVGYGLGHQLYKENVEEGKLKLDVLPITDDYVKDIKEFDVHNKINRFLIEAMQDHEWFFMSFSHHIFSKDYKKLNKIRFKSALLCRVTEPFQLTVGDNEYQVKCLVISDKWLQKNAKVSVDDEDVQVLPIIDPYWTKADIKAVLKALDVKEAAYVASYPTAGRFHYADAYWHAVIHNQWVEITSTVPRTKAAIMRHQSTIKYIAYILPEYWEAKYPKTEGKKEWEAMTADEKDTAVEKTVTMINNLIASSKNAGKTVTFPYEFENGKEKKYIILEPVDDKLKDGAWIPDSEAANTEILFAVGVDPSLIGHGTPGGKLGAGSGSDKQAAYNIYVGLKSSDRNIVFEHLQVAHIYNNWPEDVKHGIRNIELTTLDKNPTGTQNSIS